MQDSVETAVFGTDGLKQADNVGLFSEVRMMVSRARSRCVEFREERLRLRGDGRTAGKDNGGPVGARGNLPGEQLAEGAVAAGDQVDSLITPAMRRIRGSGDLCKGEHLTRSAGVSNECVLRMGEIFAHTSHGVSGLVQQDDLRLQRWVFERRGAEESREGGVQLLITFGVDQGLHERAGFAVFQEQSLENLESLATHFCKSAANSCGV